MNNTENNTNKKQGGEEQLSARDILEKCHNDFKEKYKGKGRVTTDIVRDEIYLKAMELYALQVQSKNLCVEGEKLIAFGEWLDDNKWWKSTDTRYPQTLGMWTHRINGDFSVDEGKATKDLLELFNQEYTPSTQSQNNTDTERVDVEALALEKYPTDEGYPIPNYVRIQRDSFILGYKACLSSIQGRGQ